MDIIYSKCHNGVIIVPRFADDIDYMTITSSNIPLHACSNVHVIGHNDVMVMDVIIKLHALHVMEVTTMYRM